MKTWDRLLVVLACLALPCLACAQSNNYQEQYRPQIHFSPQAHWMNDPNGMVYYKGIYHLFFQYYPEATVWGPMHWGHATSKDLLHWAEQPIALYPDSLGYIFSGSAVVDEANTSGFGKNGKVPLVAIFTSHNPKGEKAGRNDFENQSIAFSLDNGSTWTKYAHNPVLRNPGIRDFRDPKVMWYAPGKKWVMTLATKDRITFYSAPDFRDWKKESEFGLGIGAHGNVWECPDLFPLTLNGTTYWVLIVNNNPGGPNKGSATQYFVGQFNGEKFTPVDDKTRWLDYGPDEYAGVTWSNTGNRRLFLGWMTNLLYANQVPTVKWRSAMTIPRELVLRELDGDIRLASAPVTELDKIAGKRHIATKVKINAEPISLTKNLGVLPGQYILKIKGDRIKDLSLTLANDNGEKLIVGYDSQNNNYYINRTQSGRIDFNKNFAGNFTAPRFTSNPAFDITLVVDAASVELFADGGASTMTSLYFASAAYNQAYLQSNSGLLLKQVSISPLKAVW